jgi:hypothetical protein
MIVHYCKHKSLVYFRSSQYRLKSKILRPRLLWIWMMHLFSSLFSTALRPAIAIENVTLATLPGEFLVADSHVFGQGSVRAVLVFQDDEILGNGTNTDGSADENGNLDPSPQFTPFFLQRLVRVEFRQLLLVGNTSADLSHGFAFHFFNGTQSRNGSNRSTGTTHSGGGDSASAGDSFGKMRNQRLEYEN